MHYTNRVFMIFCAIIALSAFSGCGGKSDEGQNAGGTVSSTQSAATNTYLLTEDSYGLQNATYMSASNSNGLFVLRAAIADSMTDPHFSTVFRIDIIQAAQIGKDVSYPLGIPGSPVEILFFNGHRSSLLNTVSGSITFSYYGVNSGAKVAANFQAVFEDQNSDAVPRPTYSVKGSFHFVVNTHGALVPTLSPVPAAATVQYNAKCASCHALGSLDPSSAGGAPDLSLEGGEVPGKFTADVPGHNGITLNAETIHGLQVLLNAK
jgi:hypothetical protein